MDSVISKSIIAFIFFLDQFKLRPKVLKYNTNEEVIESKIGIDINPIGNAD